LLQQQRSILQSLVDNWAAMTADERKRLLASIFDSVTTTAKWRGPAGAVRRLEALRGRGHP
jgi:hypothetical protein